MNLTIFIHPDAGNPGRVFKKQIDELSGSVCPDILQDLDEFEIRLKKPIDFRQAEVFVLFVDQHRRMDSLMSLIGYFEDRRVLFVLPDKSREVLSKALKFRPRFFTYQGRDYSDLLAVIKQINKGGKDVGI